MGQDPRRTWQGSREPRMRAGSYEVIAAMSLNSSSYVQTRYFRQTMADARHGLYIPRRNCGDAPKGTGQHGHRLARVAPLRRETMGEWGERQREGETYGHPCRARGPVGPRPRAGTRLVGDLFRRHRQRPLRERAGLPLLFHDLERGVGPHRAHERRHAGGQHRRPAPRRVGTRGPVGRI